MGIIGIKYIMKMQAEVDSLNAGRDVIKKIISECSKTVKYNFLITN
jgi:hypothetical protein